MHLVLDGWMEITTHVEVISGVTRSMRTIRRWAEHTDDPLPVFRSPGGHVLADAQELEQWWWRRHGRVRHWNL
jgi:hypothetical protein